MNKLAKSRLKRMLSLTKYEAKRRHLDFNLTINYLLSLLELQDEKCALTGESLEYTAGGNYHRRNPNGVSIDRINNELGYIEGNIQLVRCKVNIIKSDLHNDEFIDLCYQVVRTDGKKQPLRLLFQDYSCYNISI